MKLIYFGVILATIIDLSYTNLNFDPLLNPWTLPGLPISPDKIKIYGFNHTGGKFFQTLNGSEMNDYCLVTDNVTLLLHGWSETITAYWVADMVNGFLINRAGCVLFIDYSYYVNKMLASYQTISYLGYPILFAYFNSLSWFVKDLLTRIDTIGYNPDNILMFVFSFGAHIGFQGAYLYSKYQQKKINAIHACDPAGPIFDQLNIFSNLGLGLGDLLASVVSPSELNARSSAKYVQCIHANGLLIGLGTTKRFCKTDINMGNCGQTQDAENATYGSHALCPLFYRSAFDNDFKLVDKPPNCTNQTYAPDVTNKYLVMGLRLDTSAQDGEYYSMTYQPPLYNAP